MFFSDYEEEDFENEERPHSNRKQHKTNLNNIEDEQHISSLDQSPQQQLPIEQSATTCYFDGDESELRIHTQQTQILPEDEDFMRDFDKTMNESLQVCI